MIGRLFTPGRRWWQLAALVAAIAEEMQRARRRGRGEPS